MKPMPSRIEEPSLASTVLMDESSTPAWALPPAPEKLKRLRYGNRTPDYFEANGSRLPVCALREAATTAPSISKLETITGE
jgi:hypothetical protein